ncbi:MAG: hypothetical protein NTY02_17825 [Acidobacteria bacterium]|nr:hypothetical protein [Acidobacteriota bacterium]
MRARLTEAALVVSAAMLLTVVMTWPLAPKIGYAGRIDSGDGQFSVWNVAWVARTIVTDPKNLFNANIFYPRRGTLAYSEANLGAGLLAVPAYWASGGNPYLAHNSVELLAFVLALTGAYSLVRYLSGRRTSAAVAGIAYAFCPYVFSHLPHIQLLFTAGLPYSLLAMHWLIDRPSLGRAIVLALALAAQALSCGYYGVFAGLLVGYGFLFYAVSRGLWRRWMFWVCAAFAAGLSVACVLPFFLPYITLQQQSGFARTLTDAARWSATWRSYGASAAWAHRWVLPYIKPWGEVLYPGTASVVFGCLGVLGLRRRYAPSSGRDHVAFYSSVAVIAFWSSLGPPAGLYAWLHESVPLFSWLRAPSRLGLVVVLALAVLAGFAIARLLPRTRRGAIAGALLVCATAADLFVAPLFLVEAQPTPAAYVALGRLPDGPVVEFPFWYRRVDFSRHSEYMLNSTFHWKPLVNGYSDFIPPDWRSMVIPVSSFPNPESFNILRQYQPRYVVFHRNFYDHRALPDLMARIEEYRDYLHPIVLEDPVWLFQIDAWPPVR